MLEVPCKICTERVLGCHGMCKDYHAYAKELGNAKKSRIIHNTYAYREKKKHERPNKMWQTHRK